MIFKRFWNWFTGLFKSPEKKIEEYLLKLLKELADVKLDTMYVIGQEKKAKAEMLTCRAKVEELDRYAEAAVMADDDANAKIFLQSRNRAANEEQTATERYRQAKEYADRMRQMHDALTDEAQTLKDRRNAIRTKIALAEAQEQINSMNSRMSQVRDLRSVYEKLEKEADTRLDTANAMAVLNESELDSQLEKLKAKYAVD